MLYDNAQLATLYLEAGAALGERRYVEVAIDTLDFLLREMQAPEGGFYASFDADSGGREGSYYVWTPLQIRAVAGGAGDGDAIARLLGVNDGGPFDGASTVSRRAELADVAAKSGEERPPTSALSGRAFARSCSRRARARAEKPRLDTKIVTAWNGLTIGALTRGFEATGDVRYRDAARRASDFLWRVHGGAPAGLVRASNGGRVGDGGVLEDYAFLRRRGSSISSRRRARPKALSSARPRSVKEADERFRAPDGGWYDAEEGRHPFPRTVNLDDSVPSRPAPAALLHVQIALTRSRYGPISRSRPTALIRARAGGCASAAWAPPGGSTLRSYARAPSTISWSPRTGARGRFRRARGAPSRRRGWPSRARARDGTRTQLVPAAHRRRRGTQRS